MQVLLFLALLRGRTVTRQQVSAFALTLYPRVVESRRRSFELAREVITTINPKAPPVRIPAYKPEYLVQAITRTLPVVDETPTVSTPLTEVDEEAQGREEILEDEDQPTVEVIGDQHIADTAAAVVRHTEQAGREGMISSVEADEDALGWARVGRGGKTCPFCLLLISRGPVYKSEETAGFRSHIRCDCYAVPVYDNENWHGRDQYLAADALYREATKGETDLLNAFRRAVVAGDIQSTLPAAA